MNQKNKIKRSEICNYCRFDEKHQEICDGVNIEKFPRMNEGDVVSYRYEYKLCVSSGNDDYAGAYFDIKYCPKCGRKLKG